MSKKDKEGLVKIAGIRLARPVYDEVVTQAAANERTIIGQVAYLVRWALATQAQQAAMRDSKSGR